MTQVFAHRLLSVFAVYGVMSVLGPSPCNAQETSKLPKLGDSVALNFKVPPRDGEFRRSMSPGFQSIACTVTAKPGQLPPTGPNYRYCLRLGQLRIGEQFHLLQTALKNLKTVPEPNISNPHVANQAPDGSRTLLIPITTTQSGNQLRLQSYLVALVDSSGVVQTLQLTGKPSETSTALTFSSITLGMPKEQVLVILGLPSSVSDVQEIQGKLWSYAPFPFSIEFTNNKVYSVRVRSPDDGDLTKTFRPLSSLPE